MATAESFHLIRCVAFGGASKPFLSRLARDKGIWSFFYSGSRSAVADHTRTRARVVEFVENEEIFILVPSVRLNEIMEFCWLQLDLDQPGRGILYAIPVEMAMPAAAPDEAMDTSVSQSPQPPSF